MEDQETYMDMLEMLAYDTLYGKHYAYDGKNPFPSADMQMGIREITVSGYEIQEDDVLIFGNAFNEFSVVYVDEKSVDTQYVNYQTLKISLDDFESGTGFHVAQEGEDHVVLSVTESVTIGANDSTEESTVQESTKVSTE